VTSLFEEMNIIPTVSQCGKLVRYSAPHVDIFLGDIFDLQYDTLGPVDAVYDRAALIALPEHMRHDYSHHVRGLTGTAKQLLITVEYDQRQQAGPPFSVDIEEVHSHYDSSYKVSSLATKPIVGGLKGKCAANEHVWLLAKKSQS
jgi:thiopurine S-methyltransferase